MVDPGRTLVIPLRRKDGPDLVALILAADLPVVSEHSWWAQWEVDGYFVAVTKVGQHRARRLLRMHTVIMDASPVSHRNGNRLDNRRTNLYIATPTSINSTRRSTGGVSAFKGVTWTGDRGKWRARIKVDGKWHQVGRYDSEREAAEAYDVAAMEAWGTGAYTNFPLSHYLGTD